MTEPLDGKIVERRKGVRQKTATMVETFLGLFAGTQSRKVMFGVWLFWAANYFRKIQQMPWEFWWYATLTAALMIGFGTIADRVVDKLADALVDFVKMIVSVKTGASLPSKTTETTSPGPDAQ